MRPASRSLLLSSLIVALVATIALAVGMATPAGAHAVVVSSNPAADERLPTAPTEVSVVFSEAVTSDLGGITVLDSAGDRVDNDDSAAADRDDAAGHARAGPRRRHLRRQLQGGLGRRPPHQRRDRLRGRQRPARRRQRPGRDERHHDRADRHVRPVPHLHRRAPRRRARVLPRLRARRRRRSPVDGPPGADLDHRRGDRRGADHRRAGVARHRGGARRHRASSIPCAACSARGWAGPPRSCSSVSPSATSP